MSPNIQQRKPLRAAARALGVPINWLRSEVSHGRIPALAAGAKHLVDVPHVQALLVARARNGSSSESSDANR